MATINSGNSTTLYSTTQTTTSVTNPSTLPAPRVNETNFTTLYSNPTAAAQGGGTSGNLLVSGNLRVLGTSDLEGAVTIGNSYILPTSDGTANQVIVTDGSGNLTFQNVTSLSSYAIQADTATGGANLTLVGSSSTDSVKFASGTNITVSRTDSNTITISTVADNIPDGTAQGQVLYWDGSAWTANNDITSSASADRFRLIYNNSTAGVSSALFLRKNFGATPFTTNDGVSVGLQIDSDSQALQQIAAIGATYDATTPSILLATNANANVTGPFVTVATFTSALATLPADLTVDGGNINLNGTAQAGVKPFLTFATQADGSNSMYGIRGMSTVDDPWFVGAGSTGDDLGYLEIATGDNAGGTNTGGQIYVRQYNGAGGGVPWYGGSGTVEHELTLLDNLGNTIIPNDLTVDSGVLFVDASTNRVGINNITPNFALDVSGDVYVSGDTTLNGDLAVNGNTGPAVSADITTSKSQASVFNTNATVLNIGGASTSTQIGASSGITTIGADLYVTGNYEQYGESMKINKDSTAADSYLYMQGTAKFLKWEEASQFFRFSDDIFGNGNIIANTSLGTNGNTIYFNNDDVGAVDSYLIVKRGASDDVSIRWNQSTNRWQFTNDGTTYYDMAVNIDDLADVVITSPLANGQLLSYKNGNWVNDNVVTTTVSADRNTFKYRPLSPSAGPNASLFLTKDYSNAAIGATGVGTYADGAGSSLGFGVISDSQGQNIYGVVNGVYSTTNPSITLATSLNNFSTNTQIASFDSSTTSLSAASLILSSENTGAAADSYLYANRGSSGADAFLQWSESNSWWGSSGSLFAAANIIAAGNLATNSTNIYFNYDDDVASDCFLQVKRAASPDVNIKWNEATDRWQTTVDGSTYLNIPNQNLDTTDSPAFAGITGGNITVGVATDNTIATTDTNGNLILAPNGTGSVAVNASSGITTNQTTFPLVNTTATTINMGGASTSNNIGAKTGGSSIISGNNRYTSPIIYNFGTAGAIPYRGLMVSNGNGSSNAVARTANVLRVFPTGAVGPRGGVIVEASRGNETTPTALQTNDLFGEFIGSGYATNSWVNDLIAAPASTYFYATENWVNTGGPAPTAGTVTNSGSGFIVSLQPTATNLTGNGASRTPVLDVNPQTFNTRSDAYNFKSKANTNLVTIASDGQFQVFNTNATANNNLYGYRTKVLSTTTENANGNNIEIKPGKLTGSTSYDKQTQVSVVQNTTDASVYANLEVKTQRFDGTNYSPTQSGDNIGRFLFNGNYATGATPAVGNGNSLAVTATENWTSGASGTKINLNITKTGTNTGLTVLEMGNASSTFKSDAYYFQNSSSTQVTGNNINYNRVYGQWQYNTLISPVAANTAYVFPLGSPDFANIASVGSTSRLIPGAAGKYNFQFSIQVANGDNGSEHTAYIWLRKNGTDVTNSMGRVSIVKSGNIISAWNYILDPSNSTDYFELAYAVDDTQVTFPTYAATAFGPSTATLITTLTPVGA